jgi:hypothetical protein
MLCHCIIVSSHSYVLSGRHLTTTFSVARSKFCSLVLYRGRLEECCDRPQGLCQCQND